MPITLTPEKAVKLKVACQHLLSTSQPRSQGFSLEGRSRAPPTFKGKALGTRLSTSLPSIRELARVIGKIVSCFPRVCFGPLYYRSLEQDKITALQLNRWDFDKKATLSPQAQEELSWWVNNVTSSHSVLTRDKPT